MICFYYTYVRFQDQELFCFTRKGLDTYNLSLNVTLAVVRGMLLFVLLFVSNEMCTS